jgi:membrane protein
MDSKPETPRFDATRPYDIPLKGWWQIVQRVGHKIVSDNLQVVTAGCAFYALFAIFPALWASISLFGLTTDADTVERQFGMLATVLPPQAYEIVIGEIRRIAETPHQALGWSFAVGLGIALWSANLGTQAMFSALNIAYGEPEHRSLLRFYLSGFICTIIGILGVVAMLFAVVYVPIAFAETGHAGDYQTLVRVGRWPFLALLVMCLLALIYRFGPSRRGAQWRWINVGAIFATAVWLLASFGFSYYVSNFSGNYDRMYGSLGAVIVLLFWLYLTFFIVLVGAEINAVLETREPRGGVPDTKPGGV